MTTHKDRVLAYLKANKTITSLTAIHEFGCTRLADIIYDLKKDGHDIPTTMIEVETRYGKPTRVAEYTLIKLAGEE